MKRALALLLPLAVAACDAPRTEQLAVRDAWVRLPAVPGRPGAAYFTLVGGNAPARLVAAESEAAARVELHETGMADGMMTMRRVAEVNVPPNAPVPFRPGGYHAMLFGMRAGVQPGTRVPLVLRLADGTRLATEAQVVGAGAPAPFP